LTSSTANNVAAVDVDVVAGDVGDGVAEDVVDIFVNYEN
jgi:hypothetical protein